MELWLTYDQKPDLFNAEILRIKWTSLVYNKPVDSQLFPVVFRTTLNPITTLESFESGILFDSLIIIFTRVRLAGLIVNTSRQKVDKQTNKQTTTDKQHKTVEEYAGEQNNNKQSIGKC